MEKRGGEGDSNRSWLSKWKSEGVSHTTGCIPNFRVAGSKTFQVGRVSRDRERGWEIQDDAGWKMVVGLFRRDQTVPGHLGRLRPSSATNLTTRKMVSRAGWPSRLWFLWWTEEIRGNKGAKLDNILRKLLYRGIFCWLCWDPPAVSGCKIVAGFVKNTGGRELCCKVLKTAVDFAVLFAGITNR